MLGCRICCKSGAGPRVPCKKKRLPLLLDCRPTFSGIGRIGTRRLPPAAASRSRGSIHYGNASSLIGGNLSLKEAWGLSFMVGTGDPPQKPHWVHALADAAWEGEGGQD